MSACTATNRGKTHTRTGRSCFHVRIRGSHDLDFVCLPSHVSSHSLGRPNTYRGRTQNHTHTCVNCNVGAMALLMSVIGLWCWW